VMIQDNAPDIQRAGRRIEKGISGFGEKKEVEAILRKRYHAAEGSEEMASAFGAIKGESRTYSGRTQKDFHFQYRGKELRNVNK